VTLIALKCCFKNPFPSIFIPFYLSYASTSLSLITGWRLD
jgi:hypothetical protein